MEMGVFAVLAIVAAGVAVISYILLERHRARYKLDNYGRPPGIKPLVSFVCPDCLHRSYAPQHVRDRFCLRCNLHFPERDGSKGSADVMN